MSFASHSPTEFFLNCPGDKCRQYEALSPDYNQYFDIKANLMHGQPQGYLVRLAFYVIGAKDAHIRFTSNANPEYANGYEIGNLMPCSYCVDMCVLY